MASPVKELHKMRKRVQNLTKRAQVIRAESGKVISRIVDAAEITASSFGFGVLQGRTGKMPEVLGVPVDLLAGIGMHGLAFFDVGDGMTRHFVAIGNGSLASFGHSMGVQVGAGMKGAPGTPPVQGELPAPSEYDDTLEGMDLTDEEIEALQGIY